MILSSKPVKRRSCLGISIGAKLPSQSLGCPTAKGRLGQHSLAAGAVTLILAALWTLCPHRVTQVVAKLCAQCALYQRLLERHRDIVNRLGRHRAFNKLFD